MKNMKTIIIILLVVGVIGLVFLLNKDVASESVEVEQVQEEVQEQISGQSYSITLGSATYSVEKGWLKKPSEEVTVTSELVSGDLIIDVKDSVLSGVIIVDTDGLGSGKEKRDSYVRSELGDSIIVNIKDQPVTFTEEGNIEDEITVQLTINDVTKDVLFSVDISIFEESLLIVGEANISMSDFGVTPPSILHVYEVGDSVYLTFDIIAN